MVSRSNPRCPFIRLAIVAVTTVLAFGAVARAQVPFEPLYSFTGGPDGRFPTAPLVLASDGNFYGTTFGGVFKMTPDGTVMGLHVFGDTEGFLPLAGLIQATDGNLYGTTSRGGLFLPGGCGFECGTVFKISPTGTFTLLHSFTGYDMDGANPTSALIQATDGYFYGTTTVGGAHDDGTVFKISPEGAVTVLHSFDAVNGSRPMAALIQGTDGNFYGTTSQGGPAGAGTVFRITAAGTLTTLHSFDRTDGIFPNTLIQATDGNFYGTNVIPGTARDGAVFRMTAGGTVTLLHVFDGVLPYALFQATDGYFYGMTVNRDTNDGTVFKMTFAGTVTVLHAFAGSVTEPPRPSGVIQGTDGNLYGTTERGGDNFVGMIYRLRTHLCRDTLTLDYTAGTLNLGFTIQSSAPTTWSAWAVGSFGVGNLWSIPIPAMSPAVSLNVPILGVPAMGPVAVFTVLSTPTQGVMCFDWKIIDTGGTRTTP